MILKLKVEKGDNMKKYGKYIIVFGIFLLGCFLIHLNTYKTRSTNLETKEDKLSLNKEVVKINESTEYPSKYSSNKSNVRTGSSTEYEEILTTPKEEEEKIVDLLKNDQTVETMKIIDGILLVNKTYGLPPDYNLGEDPEALDQLNKMIQAAREEIGKKIFPVSGFRSYDYQKGLYNTYVERDGEEKASTYSAKPGHSEHQTGLAFDIGGEDQSFWVNDSFTNTIEAKWLAENAHKYGFILRYPQGKSHITGYKYEPWHFRYVGEEHAAKIYKNDLTLEEYLLEY